MNEAQANYAQPFHNACASGDYNLSLSFGGAGYGITMRGYTMHEHLEQFSLINMNGRMYDPVLGRMLSADNSLQDPENTQNLNRYSYCLNNPFKYTDPSGNEYDPTDGGPVYIVPFNSPDFGESGIPSNWDNPWNSADASDYAIFSDYEAPTTSGTEQILGSVEDNMSNKTIDEGQNGISNEDEAKWEMYCYKNNIPILSMPAVCPPDLTSSNSTNDICPTEVNKVSYDFTITPELEIQFYSTILGKEGTSPIENVFNDVNGKLESVTYKTSLGNFGVGEDGSYTFGNSFFSSGMTKDGKYILDFSAGTSHGSYGTTIYFDPTNTNKFINFIGDALLNMDSKTPFILLDPRTIILY